MACQFEASRAVERSAARRVASAMDGLIDEASSARLTAVATTLELNRHQLVAHCLRRSCVVSELDRHARQTGDQPTIGAHEMRMLQHRVHRGAARGLLQLEAPDVISEIDPREDVGSSKVDEDAIDRGAVEAMMFERFEELGVALRTRVGVQILEDCDARLRAPKTRRTEERLIRSNVHERLAALGKSLACSRVVMRCLR